MMSGAPYGLALGSTDARNAKLQTKQLMKAVNVGTLTALKKVSVEILVKEAYK